MAHEITVVLHNTPCYTKTEIERILFDTECHIESLFDIFMMGDYIKVTFTKYHKKQDEAICDVLNDLEYANLRQLLSTIELEVYR